MEQTGGRQKNELKSWRVEWEEVTKKERRGKDRKGKERQTEGKK